MAINFPDSPITNDTHTEGDVTWTYDGTKWTVNPANQPADGAQTLTQLTDVTLGSVGVGEVLRYNGSNWADATLNYSDLTGTPTLATVATTGAYSDLTGTPTLASVATTGTFDSLSDKTITVCDETTFSFTGTALDGTNGPIQYKTLSSNTTFTNSMLEGQSITLMLADGSAFTATWPTMTWVGGSAPTLPTTGFAVIELWVVNGTLYGAHAGDA